MYLQRLARGAALATAIALSSCATSQVKEPTPIAAESNLEQIAKRLKSAGFPVGDVKKNGPGVVYLFPDIHSIKMNSAHCKVLEYLEHNEGLELIALEGCAGPITQKEIEDNYKFVKEGGSSGMMVHEEIETIGDFGTYLKVHPLESHILHSKMPSIGCEDNALLNKAQGLSLAKTCLLDYFTSNDEKLKNQSFQKLKEVFNAYGIGSIDETKLVKDFIYFNGISTRLDEEFNKVNDDRSIYAANSIKSAMVAQGTRSAALIYGAAHGKVILEQFGATSPSIIVMYTTIDQLKQLDEVIR